MRRLAMEEKEKMEMEEEKKMEMEEKKMERRLIDLFSEGKMTYDQMREMLKK
jgi:hypothetical protein